MPFKQRLKILSLLVGGILFVVFCFIAPLIGGTIIGLGVCYWCIFHSKRDSRDSKDDDLRL